METVSEFQYRWIGLTFRLILSERNSGFLHSMEYPNAYHGVAVIAPNTWQIIQLSITTPFGTYNGPVYYPNGIEQILLTLAANGMNSPEMAVDIDKENVNPREYLDFINSTLE
uniref:Uncharacterized protein n=1 Tax=Panagrolaimus sp. ES5 TaxID=591445 RepID=A0AC34FJF2_9BILA